MSCAGDVPDPVRDERAGQLIAAQPGLTLSDPLISVLWGVMVFHEQVRQGWYILGEASCAGAIVAGVIMLARSLLLAQDGSPRQDQQRDGAPGEKRARSESGTS
jgi:hypothetical protein